MIQIIADNIISGLGKDTSENLLALKQGRTALHQVEGFRVPDGGKVVASLMDDDFIDPSVAEADMTRMEKFMVSSVKRACSGKEGLLKDKSTIFIFSTTKGNIKYLGKDDEVAALWHSASVVARYFGNENEPMTVSNACISGVAAIIVAKRFLEAGLYDNAVVVGADEFTEFVVSGFGSFKALSDEPCRPFDAERKGLNLGEAVGVIVLSRVETPVPSTCLSTPQFVVGGAVTNDANHISGPSRTAEGLYRAIMRTLGEDRSGEAFINPHGTATLYNDQMENLAISRSGLSDLPVSPLKGYYGHTLGASGVIETILSCHFLDEGWLPAAKGYEAPGCDPAPDISNDIRPIKAKWFLKTVSGFGGCNAAIKVSAIDSCPSCDDEPELKVIDSFSIDYSGEAKEYLTSLYRDRGMSYPKFHKMDLLCKAGILAADRMLDITEGDDKTALVFMNSSSSYSADSEYQKTIGEDNFFPSPAVFVYTLPSIVIGEISIRHKFYGEGLFFVSPRFNRSLAMEYVRCLFREGASSRALVCWDECKGDSVVLKAELVSK